MRRVGEAVGHLLILVISLVVGSAPLVFPVLCLVSWWVTP